MKCEDVMKTVVECVSPEDTVLEAAQRMRDQQVGFLPVCGASKEILGALTDHEPVAAAPPALVRNSSATLFVPNGPVVISASPRE